MADEDPGTRRGELINPYGSGARRRLTVNGSTVRRWLILLVALLVSLALVGGTVATSCAPQTATAESGGTPAG